MKSAIIFSVFFLFHFVNLFAQNFEGTAYYKTDHIVKLDLDSTSTSTNVFDQEIAKAIGNISAERQNQIEELMAQELQKEYILKFNMNESIYKEVAKLNKPKAATGGMNFNFDSSSEVLYHNIKEERFVKESEILDKPFLIIDKLTSRNWALEEKSKMIGEYPCFKAIFSEEINLETFNWESTDTEVITKTHTITVWYTPLIPVKHGPDDYFGLPGLVLEVEDGEKSIVCTKIVLNPEVGVKIEVPTKGKIVSEVEFKEIWRKKDEEMMELYLNKNQIKNKRNSTNIKIGG
ncbi:GLPGLI family protein [Ulvibacter antarcticus]|uniref:GLPGLI family protein n=1 Tax=Ulvibacter antarcticus TaxID=442714 RepID=A0A3L9YET7_9FLAO|nr:GLPGLI family protein [Ulvibacter antarcticus]RMA57629.1 GLPGLI family protein [Ulvibacter antarcticus]